MTVMYESPRLWRGDSSAPRSVLGWLSLWSVFGVDGPEDGVWLAAPAMSVAAARSNLLSTDESRQTFVG
jgi:hypothetical protein